jgi:hypothetical protein
MGLQSPNQAYACKVSDVLEDNRSPDLGFGLIDHVNCCDNSPHIGLHI